MSKLNKKQIENELRSKIVKQYTKCIQELENDIAKLSSQLAEANERAYKVEQEKLEMRDKLNQYEVDPIHLYDIVEDELYALRA